MRFNVAGNGIRFSLVSQFRGGLPSAARVALAGIALAASLVAAGCGQTGRSGGPNASQLSPSSTSVAFGNVTVGASTSQLVTITAAGSQSVNISSVKASGTGFVVNSNSSAVLGPNQSLTISVSFQPKSAGNSTGQLLVASNASNSALKISLSGAGVAQGNGSHSVTLSWQPSASTVGYFVFRGSSSSNLAQLNAAALGSTSYTDKTIADGQTYVYAVKSISSSNVLSGFSNVVTVSVPAN